MLMNPEWQPIDTVPPDETVMVFSRRWGALIAIYSTEFRQWLPRMQCPVSLDPSVDELTHWMPMPEAPAASLGHRTRGLKYASPVADGFRRAA